MESNGPVITLLLFLTVLKVNCQFNPCPNIFQYGQDGQSEFGIISISGRQQAQGSSEVKVTIAFQKAPINDPNNPVNIEYLKSFLNTKLDALSGRDVQYRIRFPPSDYWPFPSKITLNGYTICSAEAGNVWKTTYTIRFNYPKGPKPVKNNPISYCPEILQFYSNNQENYGVVTIPSPREGTTNIQVFLSIYEDLDRSKVPSINFLKSVRQTIEDAKTSRGIQYKLRLPQYEYWPVVTKITLNGNTICNGPETTQLVTWKPAVNYDFPKLTGMKPVITIPVTPPKPKENPIIPVANKQPDNPDWLKNYRTESTCGAVFTDTSQINPSELVFGGKTIKPGEFPWLVALLTHPVNSDSFFCGATLVSEGHAITAAHCTRNRQTIFLQFGRHDFSNVNENFITRVVTATGIREHPEYVNLRAHADIAVLSFNPITFSSRIKPICLWRYETKFDNIIKSGTVVGWGRYDTRDLGNSDVPKQASINRVNIAQCRNSNDLLRSLATDQTFCAGAETATPCTGDSGGGFMVKSRNKWYLRGIISTTVGTLGSCIVENYSVFVDIIYYLDWIQGIIS